MAKRFYTEHDIMDLARQGVTSLVVDDSTVLTDLAQEEALRRGIRLLRAEPGQPGRVDREELVRRVKVAVIARLGGQVDSARLDEVVRRIVNQVL